MNECDFFFFFQGAYSAVPQVLHPMLENLIKSSNSSLFQHRTVKELLWGYIDPMLKGTVGLFAPVSKHRYYSFTLNQNVQDPLQ